MPNYTPNYQLNQWLPDDKVQRVDFNADNQKVDSALAGLVTFIAQKASTSQLNEVSSSINASISEVSGRVTTLSQSLTQTAATIPKIATGTYTGDGAESRTIPLPFPPKALLVTTQEGATYVRGGNYTNFFGGLAFPDHPVATYEIMPGTPIVQIVGSSFQVFTANLTQTSWGEYIASNREGQLYFYLAIG